LCVDYQKLDEYTVKDAHPLPHIEDNLDAMQGTQWWFSSLDSQSGYWQVLMNLQWKILVLYLDDVVVYAPTAKYTLNGWKWSFNTYKVLGYS